VDRSGPRHGAGIDRLVGSFDEIIATDVPDGRIAMSKGNDKKPKADKGKPKAGVSSYKAAQGSGKPAASPFAKKPGK
jgi:hypothetical protein